MLPVARQRGIDLPAGMAARLRLQFREGRGPQAALAAVVAWSITVAPGAFARSSSGVAGASAVLALGAGAVGPILMVERARLARHLGITAFLAFSTASWLLASQAIHGARVDPTRGLLGAVAWGVFALSWSDRWTKHGLPPDADPAEPALPSRAGLRPLAAPLATLGILGGLGYLAVAWHASDAERALVVHAAALACTVAVLSSAAVVATARGKPRLPAGRRLTSLVLRRLLLLVVFAVAGAVYLATR